MQVGDFKEPLKKLLETARLVDKDLDNAMNKKNKSFEGCVAYITDVVKKANKDNSVSMYCSDSVLVAECLHYYQEDSIDFEPNKEVKKKTEPAKVIKSNDNLDWDDEETQAPIQPKVELKTVHKAETKSKPKRNDDNSDDLFADCDW